MASPSRRSMLTAVGATVGMGVVGTTAADNAAGAVASEPTSTLILFGSSMRRLGARGRHGPGTPSTVRGSLHSAQDGPALGEFFSTGAVLAEHRMFEDELGSFETHLFTLPSGTLAGVGTVHHSGHGHFTITGGSGEYAGARGTYRSILTADHGGTGTAVFTFTIG